MNIAVVDELFDENGLQDWLSEHAMDMQIDAEIMAALEPYALPGSQTGQAIEHVRVQFSQEQSGEQNNSHASNGQVLCASNGVVQPPRRNSWPHSACPTSNTQQQSSASIAPIPASSVRSHGTISSNGFHVPVQQERISQQSISGQLPTVQGESAVLQQHQATFLQDNLQQQQWCQQQQLQQQEVDEQLMQVYQQLQDELEAEAQQQQQRQQQGLPANQAWLQPQSEQQQSLMLQQQQQQQQQQKQQQQSGSQGYPPHHGIWAEHQAWFQAHLLQQQQQQQQQVWQQQHQTHLLQQHYVLNLQRQRLNADILQQLQQQQPGVIGHLIRQQQQQWLAGGSDNLPAPAAAAAALAVAAPACTVVNGMSTELTACTYSMQSCWHHAPQQQQQQQQQMVPAAGGAAAAAAALHSEDPAMLAALPVGMAIDDVSAGTSSSDVYNSSSSSAKPQTRSSRQRANVSMAAGAANPATAAVTARQQEQHEVPEVKVKLEEQACVTGSPVTPAVAVTAGPATGALGVTNSPATPVTGGPSHFANASSDLAFTSAAAAGVTSGPVAGPAATAGTQSVPAAAAGGDRKGSSSSRAVARNAPRPTCKAYKDMCPARRFRERQKCLIKSLESELAEKLAELDLLNSEHEVLTLRSDVLRAAVACRDDQLSVLKQQERSCCAKTAAAATAASQQTADDVISQLQGRSNSMRSDAQAAAAASSSSKNIDDDSTCANSAAAAAASAAASSGSQEGADHTISHNLDEGLCLRCDVYDDITPGASEELEPEFLEQIQKWGLQDILSCWKAFTREVGEELLKIEREESAAAVAAATPAAAAVVVVKQEPDIRNCSSSIIQEALKRIEFLMQDHVVRCKAVSALNTDAYCYMFERDLDTGLPSRSSDAHWRVVVEKLKLTEQQVKRILAHSELHFSSLNRVLEERAELLQKLEQQQQQVSATHATPAAALAAAVGAGTQQQQHGGNSSGSAGVLDLSSLPCSLELVQPLLINLKREHLLKVALKCFLWSKILTPRQAAAVAVYSHPYFPDMHAIMCVMCEDAQASYGNGGRPLVFPHRAQQASRSSTLPAAQYQ